MNEHVASQPPQPKFKPHDWRVRLREEGSRVAFDGYHPCTRCGKPFPTSGQTMLGRDDLNCTGEPQK